MAEMGTPLHFAARQGHHEVVALLLGKGADVKAKDCNEWTSLHCAADEGHNEVVALLLEKERM